MDREALYKVLENYQTEAELEELKKTQIKFKVYWHWYNWNDIEESSIILYSNETGYLEYFDTGFFTHHSRREDILSLCKVNTVFQYLGVL